MGAIPGLIRDFEATGARQAWVWVGSDVWATADAGRSWVKKFSILEDGWVGHRLICEGSCGERAWVIGSWAEPGQFAESRGIKEYRRGRPAGRVEVLRVARFYSLGSFFDGSTRFVWFDSRLFHSKDGGVTWSQIDYGCPREEECKVRHMWRRAGDELLLSRRDGVLLQSADSGTTWRKLAGPLWTERRGVEPANRLFSEGAGMAVLGLDRRIHRSTNGGKSWTQLDLPGAPMLVDFRCVSNQDCLSLEAGGELRRFVLK